MIAHAGFVDHAALVLIVVSATGVYAVLWSRCRRSRRPGQLWVWGAAMVTLAAITSPPVERLTDRSFTWHMAQHLVLLAVVAPLLMLAHPLRVLLDAWPVARRSSVGGRLRVAGRRFGAVPRTLAALALLFAVHAGRIYDAALGHRLLHDAQHLGFLLSAGLLWSIAFAGPSRRAPQKIAAAFGVGGALTLLSLWIMALDEPLSRRYTERLGAAAALDDQRTGAALMWVGMVSLTVPLLLVVVWQWAATEQRVAERAEAIADGRHDPSVGSSRSAY